MVQEELTNEEIDLLVEGLQKIYISPIKAQLGMNIANSLIKEVPENAKESFAKDCEVFKNNLEKYGNNVILLQAKLLKMRG